MVNTDNRNIEAIRAENKARLDMIAKGDIVAALQAQKDASRVYRKMSESLHGWANAMKDYERRRMDSEREFAAFAQMAERMMGGSLRVILAECDDEVKPEDVNVVTDDALWLTLLARISNADGLNALKMTKAAYKVAVESIGSFKSKCLGLENRINGAGTTEAERETASALLRHTSLALEIVVKRKDTIVELNLKLRDAIAKFCNRHKADPKDCRGLTKEEIETLKGLI